MGKGKEWGTGGTTPRVYYSPNIVEKEQTRSKREQERETRDEQETSERDVCVRER